MVKPRILNPQASTAVTLAGLGSRACGRSGKTVGPYWNMRAGGDVALERTPRILGRRLPGAEFGYYVGSVGANMRHATPEDTEPVARECQAAAGTTGD